MSNWLPELRHREIGGKMGCPATGPYMHAEKLRDKKDLTFIVIYVQSFRKRFLFKI